MTDDDQHEPISWLEEYGGEGDPDDEPSGPAPGSEDVTISEAAERAGVHRSTIRRALDRDKFPHAWQDVDAPRQPWRIPVSDLDDAGYPAADTPGEATHGAVGEVEGQAEATTQGATSTAMVPLEAFHDLLQRLTTATSEATTAAAERDHLRGRLEERQAEAEAARREAREAERRAAEVRRRAEEEERRSERAQLERDHTRHLLEERQAEAEAAREEAEATARRARWLAVALVVAALVAALAVAAAVLLATLGGG